MDLQISKIQQNFEQIAQICSTTAMQLQQCAQVCRQAGLQLQQTQGASQMSSDRQTGRSINTNFAPTYLDLFSETTLEDIENITGH